VSTGAYYLYSHGVDPGAAPHTHFVAGRVSVANAVARGRYVVQIVPQVFYLRTNGQSGTYVGATASVGRRGSPWSITTIVNQPLKTGVTGGTRFLWNGGVTYAFR
jgi:hypothetical protein